MVFDLYLFRLSPEQFFVSFRDRNISADITGGKLARITQVRQLPAARLVAGYLQHRKASWNNRFISTHPWILADHNAVDRDERRAVGDEEITEDRFENILA